ncbi:phage terminase small subunit P27 family [Peribacillus asahii]|uniref:phage terminase small subunit P27 family n=1 Tax=Peribacillus asahii TaxID=228899 RepID=UPI002079E4D3|nr:phage terminase small subunit P27 family [Peribacillus asahii]USK85716.1 phage terminase small subunit P27 family [Peribacillus asahii]
MGRARQPVSLLVYKGNKNLTKKEIEERAAQEVKAAVDKVKPPTYLPRDLKREFKKIASELVQVGIMTNLDNDALARFLLARKMYLELTDNLLNMESVLVNKNTGEKSSNKEYADVLISQDKLFKQCRTAASDLGLTISSRCRLVVPKSEKKEEQTPEEKRFGDV